MASYDSDPITKALDYWGDADSEWEKFKTHFATKPKVARVDDLIKVDSFLEGEVKPTREHASMLTKKRQLEDIHWALDRINK